jgi:hypothetical protein
MFELIEMRKEQLHAMEILDSCLGQRILVTGATGFAGNPISSGIIVLYDGVSDGSQLLPR